ncbi:NAD(P)-binding domain-containing protein [Streptomyces sp. NPDC051956]|uniref:NAD(P)-binding domain-containing protein n=1 Tax=Streptomyces sp. NPDC051956 TaxID=3365677 RepID=UPI0037D12F79
MGTAILIAGSGDPERIALTDEVLALGAEPAVAEQAAAEADFIVLALQLGNTAAFPLRRCTASSSSTR